jgi:hypothetical protein
MVSRHTSEVSLWPYVCAKVEFLWIRMAEILNCLITFSGSLSYKISYKKLNGIPANTGSQTDKQTNKQTHP